MSEAITVKLQGNHRVASERAAAIWAALALLLVTTTADAVAVRVDVLDNATMSQLTHTTCTVSPLGKAAANRFLMIEGPDCRFGGGACQHVALMKIDRRTLSFARTDEPRKSANGTWTSGFKLGEMTLSVDMIPKPSGRTQSDSDTRFGAVLTLNDGKGNSTKIKGIARCEDN